MEVQLDWVKYIAQFQKQIFNGGSKNHLAWGMASTHVAMTIQKLTLMFVQCVITK